MDFKSVIDNFVTVVSKKYFCFEGRAGRKEFWQFFLVCAVAHIVLGWIPRLGPVLSLLLLLGLLLPTLGVTARRLHDRGQTGWLQLLALIPVVGGLIVLLMCVPEGDKEANAFGDAAAE